VEYWGLPDELEERLLTEDELEEREWNPDLAEAGTGASLGTVSVGGIYEGALWAATGYSLL
jgi:hypothetical protein